MSSITEGQPKKDSRADGKTRMTDSSFRSRRRRWIQRSGRENCQTDSAYSALEADRTEFEATGFGSGVIVISPNGGKAEDLGYIICQVRCETVCDGHAVVNYDEDEITESQPHMQTHSAERLMVDLMGVMQYHREIATMAVKTCEDLEHKDCKQFDDDSLNDVTMERRFSLFSVADSEDSIGADSDLSSFGTQSELRDFESREDDLVTPVASCEMLPTSSITDDGGSSSVDHLDVVSSSNAEEKIQRRKFHAWSRCSFGTIRKKPGPKAKKGKDITVPVEWLGDGDDVEVIFDAHINRRSSHAN